MTLSRPNLVGGVPPALDQDGQRIDIQSESSERPTKLLAEWADIATVARHLEVSEQTYGRIRYRGWIKGKPPVRPHRPQRETTE